jgi:hypothetical protein
VTARVHLCYTPSTNVSREFKGIIRFHNDKYGNFTKQCIVIKTKPRRKQKVVGIIALQLISRILVLSKLK